MPEVFEHSKLYFGQNGLRNDHRVLLSNLKEQIGVNFLSFGYDYILTNHYVGVIQVDDFVLEILPKADSEGIASHLPSSEIVSSKWRNALIQMLVLCYDLNITSHPNTNVSLKNNTLIDILFSYFLNEVELILQKYRVKKYIKEASNLNFLKGKLNFSKQIQKNFIHPERFYTDHESYTQNNPYNQILKYSLFLIHQVSLELNNRNKAKLLLSYFDDVNLKTFSKADVANLPKKKNATHYRTAMGLAELILRNLSPDIRVGDKSAFGMLFDMNKLFEMTVYRLLKKQESKYNSYNLTVANQLSQRFWRSKTIRPDILLNFNVSEKSMGVVIDTKWKLPRDKEPSDVDIKQIYVYNLEYNCEIGLLLYPATGNVIQEDKLSLYPFDGKPKELNHYLGLYFIDIFDTEGNLSGSGLSIFLNQLIAKCRMNSPEGHAS